MNLNKKNDILISIIIPVFNVERFLNDCLRSVSAQTYKNIEIILIDDGSTDSSGAICDEYAIAEKRAKVVHQKNQGLSGARNTGIDCSSGEYISFLDSDDIVNPGFIEQLYNALVEQCCDISVCDYCRVDEDEHIFNHDEFEFVNPVTFNNFGAIEAVYDKAYHGMQYIAWGKLFKKRIFIDNNMRFPIGKIHEDTFTIYKVLYAADMICYIAKPLYGYRIRAGSIMNSGFSEKSLVKFDAIKEECEFFRNHNEYKLYEMAFFHLLFEKKNTIHDMVKDKNVEQEKILKFAASIREDMKSYSGNRSIPMKKRLFYTLLSIYPILSRIR